MAGSSRVNGSATRLEPGMQVGIALGGCLQEARLLPTAFSTADGIHVSAARARLPEDFVSQLRSDITRLRCQAAEAMARFRSGGAPATGALIDFDPVIVDGRLALRRTERVPDGLLAGVVYAGALIVPLSEDISAEIVITWRPNGSDSVVGDEAILMRIRSVMDDLVSLIHFTCDSSW